MPIIKNFGHFWSRDAVVWGRQGQSGEMYGYRYEDRNPLFTDFREQKGIYVLFSGQREIVYIGQAGRSEQSLFARLKQHARGSLRDRWAHFSWFGFRRVNSTVISGSNRELSKIDTSESNKRVTSLQALDEFESMLLQIAEPRLNKQGPRWGEAAEYLQYVPWDWDYEEHEARGFPVSWENKMILDRLGAVEQRLVELKKNVKV